MFRLAFVCISKELVFVCTGILHVVVACILHILLVVLFAGVQRATIFWLFNKNLMTNCFLFGMISLNRGFLGQHR